MGGPQVKVSVRNLGVIKEAEIDLKPLTILIGPNNAGKTWLAYTLSGIFGLYGLAKYIQAYTEEKVSKAYPILDHAVEQILDEGNAKIDLVQFADEYGETYFNNMAKLAPHWIQDFLGTELAPFDKLEVHINLAETKEHILEKILWFSIERKLSFGRGRRESLLAALKEPGKKELYVYTSTEGSIAEKLPHRAIKEFLVGLVFQGLHTTLYEDLYTFPTERTIITYPSVRSDLVEEKTIISEVAQQEPRSPTSWPMLHFLNMILTLFQCGLADREREAKKVPTIRAYMQLAQWLEKQILGGEVNFSTPEPDPRRVILFTPTDGDPLEIPVTSSMVKELSPLVLYLRYLASPGEWLIIDEPEMNLHPKAQAQLTEFLAMLVNAGLPVLITTHSPYIVDHLANLMKAAESTEPEAIQDKFYLQRKEAFISRYNVSVYSVDQGKTENVLDEDGLVRWGTFSDVSDRVSEIYFEL